MPTNYKLQITIYETKGRQVEDPPAADHLQPHEQLLSPVLFVREFDHVPTRAGQPEPEGRVLHTVHAQDEQVSRQGIIFILVPFSIYLKLQNQLELNIS